ncbi:hypothetical protein H4219_003023 [Mycoemilia scoparia]|uniref:Uncharacterized protein n=1 Tax=Mycoemilia scoparia TaxID=417184 RepID=A0A9W8A408_9FUNG|nr:hypothetical protein H4219_003023 [Mycoemilia scoparia]
MAMSAPVIWVTNPQALTGKNALLKRSSIHSLGRTSLGTRAFGHAQSDGEVFIPLLSRSLASQNAESSRLSRRTIAPGFVADLVKDTFNNQIKKINIAHIIRDKLAENHGLIGILGGFIDKLLQKL